MFLLIFILGCSSNKEEQITPNIGQSNYQNQNTINEDDQYMKQFYERYKESDIKIEKKYFIDLNNDNKKEQLILFDYITEKQYVNFVVITSDVFYYLHLRSDNKLRFTDPIDIELGNNQTSNSPEINVSLQNIETQETVNYYLTMEKINGEVALRVRS